MMLTKMLTQTAHFSHKQGECVILNELFFMIAESTIKRYIDGCSISNSKKKLNQKYETARVNASANIDRHISSFLSFLLRNQYADRSVFFYDGPNHNVSHNIEHLYGFVEQIQFSLKKKQQPAIVKKVIVTQLRKKQITAHKRNDLKTQKGIRSETFKQKKNKKKVNWHDFIHTFMFYTVILRKKTS